MSAWVFVSVSCTLSVVLLASGCRHSSAGPQEGETEADAMVFRAEDGYWVETPSSLPCTLRFGTEEATVVCSVQTTGTSDQRRHLVRIGKGSQELEERYSSDRDAVRFVGAGSDRFEPPIPLIEFGRHVGDQWNWSGINIVQGEPALAARANVRTSEELLRLPSGTVQTVKVTVTIYLGERRKPADEMRFWFAPGLGLIRTELCGYCRVSEPPAE